ncbi:MAG: hypothetical protein ACRENP_19235 [Longimicrobiales bacterium]
MHLNRVGAFLLGLLLLGPPDARAQVVDVVDGYVSGRAAGNLPRVTMGWGVSTATITLLTAFDQGPVTNNRVVSTAVVNAAIGAGVSWTVNRLLRPAPSISRNPELLRASEAYRDSFNRGYKESLGGRQMVSNVLGVITGSVVAGAIFMLRK